MYTLTPTKIPFISLSNQHFPGILVFHSNDQERRVLYCTRTECISEEFAEAAKQASLIEGSFHSIISVLNTHESNHGDQMVTDILAGEAILE